MKNNLASLRRIDEKEEEENMESLACESESSLTGEEATTDAYSRMKRGLSEDKKEYRLSIRSSGESEMSFLNAKRFSSNRGSKCRTNLIKQPEEGIPLSYLGEEQLDKLRTDIRNDIFSESKRLSGDI